MARLYRNETADKPIRQQVGQVKNQGVFMCVCVGEQQPGNVLEAFSKRGCQSEHMVITEGSVTSLSCLVTISAHEESNQNRQHVEAPAHCQCCHAENAF